MLKVLDNVLLADKVVDEFYNQYADVGFRNWLLGLIPEVEDCKNLKQVTFGDRLLLLEEGIFSYCDNLQKIINLNTRTISNYMFENCLRLSLFSTFEMFTNEIGV